MSSLLIWLFGKALSVKEMSRDVLPRLSMNDTRGVMWQTAVPYRDRAGPKRKQVGSDCYLSLDPAVRGDLCDAKS